MSQDNWDFQSYEHQENEQLCDDSYNHFCPLNPTKKRQCSDNLSERSTEFANQNAEAKNPENDEIQKCRNIGCFGGDEEQVSCDQQEDSMQFIHSNLDQLSNYPLESQEVPQNPQVETSTSQRTVTKKVKKNKKREIYMLPGESKNIPKNFVRGLKSHIIRRHLELSQKDQDIKKFLNLKPEKACKQSLERALQTPLLKQIGRMYFGSMQWSLEFLEENKVGLEPYFRFNSLWI